MLFDHFMLLAFILNIFFFFLNYVILEFKLKGEFRSHVEPAYHYNANLIYILLLILLY